jgi:hypothetical protein
MLGRLGSVNVQPPAVATLVSEMTGQKVHSDTGNRTPVSRVTGGDTSHYTMSDVQADSAGSPLTII